MSSATTDVSAKRGAPPAPGRDVTWLVVAVAAVLTVALTWGVLERPRRVAPLAVGAVVLLAVAAARRAIPRVTLERIVAACLFVIPIAALLGPSAALPGLAQLFAFRVAIVLLVAAGLVWAFAGGRLTVTAPRTIVVLFALWYAWLAVTLLWAPDKEAGLRYIGLVFVEALLMVATAAAGSSRRWLRATVTSLAVVYGLSLVVALVEIGFGWHLASSVGSHGGKTHAATGFLYNPNDLATFIAIAWPFLLLVFATPGRTGRRVWALLALGVSAFVLVRTGSRASLLAIGLSTAVAPWLLVRRRWVRRPGVVVAVTVVALIGVAVLAFNTSDNAFLRQFRLVDLTQETDTGVSSGGTRASLIDAGAEAGVRYLFLGVGPGNAEVVIARRPEAPSSFANVHNWWWEVFVNGGVPGLVLFAAFYFGLARAANTVSRTARDRFLALVSGGVLLALVGFVVGALGPSTAVSFAPMWVLLGLALAVVRRRQRELREAAEPVEVGEPGEAGEPAEAGR